MPARDMPQVLEVRGKQEIGLTIMNTLLASVCYLVLATGETHCQEPVKFEEARREVERKVVAQAEFFDPTVDKNYYYLKPVEPAGEARAKQLARPAKPVPERQVEEEPFVRKYNTRKYPPRYARGGYRATMEPVR